MQRPARLAAAMLLTALAIASMPFASASACDLKSPDVECTASAGPCDASAGGNVITTTAAGAEADCQGGGAGPTCHTAVGVGQDLFDPTLEHWCAF